MRSVVFYNSFALRFYNELRFGLYSDFAGEKKTEEYYTRGRNCTGMPSRKFTFPDSCLETPIDTTFSSDPTDDDREIFNPPPSVSTTPFPTATSATVPGSFRFYCSSANAKVTLKATQVSTVEEEKTLSMLSLAGLMYQHKFTIIFRPLTASPSPPTTPMPSFMTQLSSKPSPPP